MVHVNQVIDFTLTAIDNKDLGLAQSWFQKNKHETLESFKVILENRKSSYFSNGCAPLRSHIVKLSKKEGDK